MFRAAFGRALGATGVAGGLGLGAWVASGDDVERAARCSLLYNVPRRLAVDVVTLASIVSDYRSSLTGLEIGSPQREEAKHECHVRGAQRLLDMCFANGGIYIKLAQHVGQLDHLLPAPYVDIMREHALDKCPVSSYEEVRRTIHEDFGQFPEDLFKSFNPVPIASASLAQVHVAHDWEGRKLAVKVQHAGLRETAPADVATIELLVEGVRRAFPKFDYRWLVDEVKFNLPKELDFVHEAENADRCRANLASSRSRLGGRVVVPEIVKGLVSDRVVTMEFMEGCGVTDRHGLSGLGVSPSAVAQLVAATFNEMVFTHGDVHCDPHAANLLVRRGPKDGKMQLVLLDHGLYRCIDDDFRREYAGLWRALIFADEDGIREHSSSMNAGDMYPIFAAMLTSRPWDAITDGSSLEHLALGYDDADRALLQKYAAEYSEEISELLLRMPRELLLLLKTNDCLRSIDRCLGQPVNTFVITARECSRALAERRSGPSSGMRARWWGLRESLAVEWRVLLMRSAGVWASVFGAPAPREPSEAATAALQPRA